ncbi:MAG TPA: DUF2225 domain-containing protein [Candidatus Acidoferrum sp.]|nr:DUF2225 domain-containing protein [Candidatus Acidoferrum sp.]
MSETKSALFSRTVACPACGAVSGQPEFKTGMFAEEEREADQHVLRYRWLRSDVPPLHPPFYALAHCPRCGFTDFKEDFFDPARSRENRAPLIAPRLKAEATRRGSPVETLRQGLSPGALDFPGALRLHLLAVALQELLPDERRDHLKLARLYLRTAWLYREQGDTGAPSLVEDTVQAALDQCAAALRGLRESADQLATAVAGTPRDPLVAEWKRQADTLGQRYADLRTRCLGPAESAAPLDFLARIRGDWPAVPLAEPACLEAAVQAFERVYQQGEGDTLALLKLMIELNYRLGRSDRVLEYVGSISKSGQEERLRLQRHLDANRGLAPAERAKLTTRVNRITAMLQLAAEIRKDALGRQATPAHACAPG